MSRQFRILKFFCKENYPNYKILRPLDNNRSLKDIFFSNVSSALRKDILEKYPFNEQIIMSEDQEWAKSKVSFETSIPI